MANQFKHSTGMIATRRGRPRHPVTPKRALSGVVLGAAIAGTGAVPIVAFASPTQDDTAPLTQADKVKLPDGNNGVTYDDTVYDPATMEPPSEGDGQDEFDAWIAEGQPGYIPDRGGSKGVGTPTNPVEAPTNPVETPTTDNPLVNLANAARADAGCDPLVADPALMASAQGWAEEMVATGYRHSDLEGGVRAENIAWGYETPEAVHAAWMDSPGHRRNILNCEYTTIGVGELDEHWVEQFGDGPVTTPATTSTDPAIDHDWSGVVQCESSGNWEINSGNGYSGGVQFYPPTWDAYGGQEFAPFAHLATPEEQLIVAERVGYDGWNGPNGYVAPQGMGAWPECGKLIKPLAGASAAAAPALNLTAPCSDHGVAFSEMNMQPAAVKLARAVCAIFGTDLTIIGGWRASDPYPDHPSGRAIDIMTSDYMVGTAINDWIRAHADEYGVDYTLWQVADHFDHIHATVY